ncbi:hypothetical protein JW960_26520 [candidate division KSB1 bacterium]|nr:hypothetical protein [candidate division KSB1 bacterium]
MSKIIIGIHGLQNKPAKGILKKWWRRSIMDGLKALGYSHPFFKFEMVYWADLFYPRPLQSNIKDEKDPYCLSEPYVKPQKIEPVVMNSIRKKILRLLEQQMDRMFFNDDMSVNFSGITDLILRRFFKDLNIYYTGICKDRSGIIRPARDVLREELATVLHKHRRKQILLIGHSMGSIIAYDVLQHVVPQIKIDTFVTMGSPLGLPVIIHKSLVETYKEVNNSPVRPKTPENVLNHWYNFSDLHDRVALNFDLADDYDANQRNVQVVDFVVNNDYRINGNRNPHKIYGYLRTPEFTRVVHDFLGEGFFGRWGLFQSLFTDSNPFTQETSMQES